MFYSKLKKLFLTQIEGSLISSNFKDDNETIFDFTLDQTVSITEAFYPNFDLLEFLTSTGGAVGLWLGLGLVQVVKHMVLGAQVLKWHK